MSTKIWVLTPALEKYDLIDAERFGKITPIFKGIPPTSVDQIVQSMTREIIPMASETDFTLVAGPSIMLMTMTAIWLEHFQKMRILAFSTKTSGYIERILTRQAR